MKKLKSILIVAICLAMSGSVLFAGTTGKIAGTVIDSETKDPLPGAVVQILGTSIGANTDLDGRYVLLNVPVGTYSVQARMMGYEPVTVTNVKSIMDLTTPINFKLKPTVIELKGQVVEAKRQMVIPDATTTTRVTSTKEIMALPNAGTNTVVQNTAGVVSSGGQMNVRGGRSDEMAYFVDGASVTDALSGAMGAQINTAAIEEVMVITGGFNAEYGEAMSGVVNVVTKEGGDKTNLYARYTTDMFMASKSRNDNKVEGSIGGPIPFVKDLGYFISAEVRNTDDYRPVFMQDKYYVHDATKDYFWGDTLRFSESQWDSASTDTLPDRWVGGWMDSTDARWEEEKARRLVDDVQYGWKEWDEVYLPHNDFNSYRFQGKLAYKIPALNAKITLGGFANRDQRGMYIATWKYDLENYGSYLQKAYQLGGTWRHQIGKNTFYTLIFNTFSTRTQTGVRDTVAEKDRSWWEDYTFLSDADTNNDVIFDAYDGQASDNTDVNNPWGVSGIFYTSGLYRLWEKTEAAYKSLKLDVTSQVDKNNQIQSGIDFKLHHVFRKYNSLPWTSEPFQDYYDNRPITLAAYLQDKMEFQGFVVNAGLRLDYLNPRNQKKVNNFNLTDTASMVDAKAKWKLSPRLGISHPISERTVLHMSYGHFFQQPQLQYLYESLQANISRGNTIMGDPDLGAQRTIAYEAGFNHQFTNDVAGDVTMYYKDIFDLMGTRLLQDSTTGLNYTSYLNAEYGNVRGFEISVQQRPSNGIFSGRVSYSLSYAKGSASSADEGYLKYVYGGGTDPATGLPIPFPKTDNPLDFDQRHTFSVSTSFDFGDGYGFKALGFKPMANVSINILNNIGSGMPYTKLDSKGQIVGESNEGRMPWSWRTDLSASKTFKVAGLNWSLNFEVLNLFNRKNVANIYQVTGLADNDGKIISLGDFDPTPYRDSLTVSYYGDVNGDGDPNDTLKIPNPYYSRWADLNQDGMIDQYEKYISYVNAWNDLVTDPRNGNRSPGTYAYNEPRTMKMSLGFNF